MLKFSPANRKTKALYQVADIAPFLGKTRKVYSLDITSGESCPGAKLCKSRVVARQDDPTRFTILDGPHCEFRCFSASQEVLYGHTRIMRRHNFDCLRKMRGWKQCRDLLANTLPPDIGVLRFHVAGDFFKLSYLRGALALAERRPDILFYSYSKSLRFFEGIDMADPANGVVTDNFRITASKGGHYDHLIGKLGLREARVVLSEEEAEMASLPIDHNDSHASSIGGSFAVLIHGTQPAGSKASVAKRRLKGKGSYGKSSK